MISLAIRGILARRAQTLTVAIGLVITLAGFAVLAGGARRTAVELTGDIGKAWDTPFDLLVRPAGAADPLERSAGLIRPNYVSGIHGGMTMGQLSAIRAAPGVTLAAPLAAIGAVNWPSAYELPLARPVASQLSVYRIRSAVTGQAGLSRYPLEARYIVVAPSGVLSFDSQLLTVPGRARPISCTYPVNCFAGTVCVQGRCSPGQYPSPTDARYYLPLLQPIQIVGIDPTAEAELAGLGDCVRQGRLLTAGDRLSSTEDPEPAEVLPVMASSKAFLDQTLRVDVDTGSLGAGEEPASILDWQYTKSDRPSLNSLYQKYLATSVDDYLDPWPIWSAGDVRYRARGPDHLAAVPVRPNPAIFTRVNTFLEVGITEGLLIPPEVRDPWFRRVTEHKDAEAPGANSGYRSKMWNVVGRYDPDCLRGFDRLAGATLEAYATPDVRLADGRRIRPTRSMSDYVGSPPLLLTTLESAGWLADPKRYVGQPGKSFISVVRVRVAGTDRPGPASERRLTAAAAAIHQRTGLRVDIVKGASTRQIDVDLPAGQFGRPAVTVEEQWSVKGVSVRFFNAVQAQDRALLALLLVGGGLLVGQAGYISVRQRRRQLAVLRGLGWSPLRLASLIEVECLTIGVVAGLLASLVALPMLLLWNGPLVLAAITPLIGVVIAGVAGLPAGVAASRGSVISVLAGNHPVRRSRPPRTAAGLAMRELRTAWPIETAVAIIAVALGAALVGLVVLVAADFRSQLDTTVLGTTLDTQVRPFHVALSALTLAIGSTAAAQVILLAWLSRRPHLGVLRATGWSGFRLASFVGFQAVGLGAGGCAVAGLVVLGGAALLDASAGSVRLALVAALCGGLTATLVAAAGPGLVALRASPRRLLSSA